MIYKVRMIEKNISGDVVRNQKMMQTVQKARALAFYHDKVLDVGLYPNGRSKLILEEIEGDEINVIREFNF